MLKRVVGLSVAVAMSLGSTLAVAEIYVCVKGLSPVYTASKEECYERHGNASFVPSDGDWEAAKELERKHTVNFEGSLGDQLDKMNAIADLTLLDMEVCREELQADNPGKGCLRYLDKLAVYYLDGYRYQGAFEQAINNGWKAQSQGLYEALDSYTKPKWKAFYHKASEVREFQRMLNYRLGGNE